jgi:helicase MOV-10
MNLFLESLRCILCCHEERDDDNDDLASCIKPFLESSSAKVRNRNPAYEYLPVNTTPSNSPRSRVTLSAPLYQPNVGNSPTTKPPYSQKSMERTNDVYQNSTSSSPLPPTFPYSSKLLQYTSSPFPSSPFPSSSKSATSSSKPSASFPNALLSSSKPPQSVSKLSPPSSSLKDPTYSSKSSASSSNLPPYSFSPSSKSSVSSPNDPKPPPESSPTYSKPPQSLPSLTPSSSKPLPSSPKPASSHKPSLFSPKGLPSSSGPPPSSPSQTPAFKPILSLAPSNVINEEMKMSYVLGKGTSRIYAIPEDIKGLIKKDILPEVLKQPLSPSTYKHYFAALLYAEDFHLEVLMNALRYCCF